MSPAEGFAGCSRVSFFFTPQSLLVSQLRSHRLLTQLFNLKVMQDVNGQRTFLQGPLAEPLFESTDAAVHHSQLVRNKVTDSTLWKFNLAGLISTLWKS